MSRHLLLAVAVLAPLSLAAAADYKFTILDPHPPGSVRRPEYRMPSEIVGKSIVDLFGPISEVRVERDTINTLPIDKDPQKVEKAIRERIDSSKCLGRDSEVPWHQAPWVEGYILFKNGRILPAHFMLSGTIVGDFLFDRKAP